MYAFKILAKTVVLLLCSSNLGAAAPSQNNRFTFYKMPTKLAGPCDLSTGPDGAIWVSDFLVPKVARVDPHTGHVEEYNIPYTAPILNVSLPGLLGELVKRTTFGCVSQPGEDGKMYFASGVRNQFAQMNIETKEIKVFDFHDPLGNLQPLNDMWRGPTGMFISQTTANKVSLFDYKTSKIKDFVPPTKESSPVGIYLASDGYVYFCEFLANKIGRLNFTTGEIREFDVPVPFTGPAVMRAETKENGRRLVWFTGFIGNKMGSIDIDTHEIKLHHLPELESLPVEDTVDSKGNVWYSSATYNTLNKIITKTGRIVTVNQPGSITTKPGLPPKADIAIHFGPGNDIWFTELAKNRVGRYKLRS